MGANVAREVRGGDDGDEADDALEVFPAVELTGKSLVGFHGGHGGLSPLQDVAHICRFGVGSLHGSLGLVVGVWVQFLVRIEVAGRGVIDFVFKSSIGKSIVVPLDLFHPARRKSPAAETFLCHLGLEHDASYPSGSRAYPSSSAPLPPCSIARRRLALRSFGMHNECVTGARTS
jgi:hypothetical protein